MTRPRQPDTILAHAGLRPSENHGIVNPPVYHASTILHPTLDAFEASAKAPFDHFRYGRMGTPTTRAFEEAVAAIEGGYRAVSTGCGLSAIVVAMTAFLQAGDHVLMTDSVYGPTRKYCDAVLARFGVETTYYDPLIGAAIDDLIRDTTKIIFLESPGSHTFEIQDVPAITAVARRRGVLTMIDNTWGTPLYFRAFDHGVDLSIHAATKYMVGHSDAMMGVITCRTAEQFDAVKTYATQSGHAPGPDDAYLAQRGLRTMAVRLKQHQDNALTVARWLQDRPEVVRVLHPALPDDPGHALWKRDFTGACGLFAMLLKPAPRAALAALIDGMELFGLGASWGGYESLILPADPAAMRTARPWREEGRLVRLHVGLEDPADLIADLEAGLQRYSAAAGG